jgi:Fe-S-cluster-containing dehydrogenase component
MSAIGEPMTGRPLPPDLAALADALREARGRRFWRTLEEASGTEPFRRYLAEEFRGLALPEIGRRDMLRAMAASFLMAGLTGCSEDEAAIPYVRQPELAVPGQPRFYASAVPFEGFAQPVLAETHEGRPTRLDGNPDHPLSRGSVNPTALDPLSQAAVLELYDPDRSQSPRFLDRPTTWDAFTTAVINQRARWLADGGRGVRLLTGGITSPTLLRLIATRGNDIPDQPRHATANERLPTAPARIPLLAHTLARMLSVPGAEGDVELAEAERHWVANAADLLRRHAERGLVIAGTDQPPEVQAIAHRINSALDSNAVVFTAPIAAKAEPLDELVRAMGAAEVQALLMLEVNPVYDAPADLAFAEAMERVPLQLHAGLYADETAAHSHWHVPVSHALESWGDGRTVDGTASIIQPTIRPIFGGHALVEIVQTLLGDPFADAQSLVRDTWRDRLEDEAAWRQALHQGFIENTAEPPVPVSPTATRLPPPSVPEADTLELTFLPDPCLWDGRRANVAWLQELPKPVSKISWDSYVAVSPELARDRNLEDGDLVDLEIHGRSLRAPVLVQPGQAARSLTVFLGGGRWRAGRVGDGVGFDAYRLRTAGAPWSAPGLRLTRAEGRHPLVTTQPHHEIAEAEPIRMVTPENPALDPIGKMLPSIYTEWPYPVNAWAMAIDTDLCIGCNACVVACQAENNVPSVGREQVAMGREMLWLRVDSYYEGAPENPNIHFLPVPCMHCEKAPCEVGCPVNATMHSPDGINEQVYNRCIGTRTCSSYCPYKVRRFNFFEYGRIAAPQQGLQYNPDVTVRARGVMEKCTYCIQRIARARQDAKRDGRDPAAIEIRTACQAACPTGVIAFGDKNRPDSAVAQARKDPRTYVLLKEIGTRPRTTYLAKIGEHRRTKER